MVHRGLVTGGAFMNKVLMVTYFFPPIASVGVFRTLKFAKYLPRFGWKPVILTVKNPDHSMVKSDPHYAEDRLSGVKVFRSYSVPLGWMYKIHRLGISHKWFVIPDIFIGWLRSTVSLGKKIVAKERIDVIYASCPPATSLVIGALLKRITRKPLVVDYRDPWTNNPFTSYPTRVHYSIEKKIENRILRNCDVIITTTEFQKQELLKAFPFLRETDVHVITNGYDPDDFLDIEHRKSDKFTIVHAGTIYGPRAKHFGMFFKALGGLLRRGKIPDFRIVLIGNMPPSTERDLSKLVQESDLTTQVHYLGQKSHREAIQFIFSADLLLLIPGSPVFISGKVFEYLAARRFILNISDPTSETAGIISRAKAGITVEPNVELLQEALHEVFALDNAESRENEEFLSKFSRMRLTENLASVLDKLVR